MTRPQCIVIAGPNGAGKTSAAPELLKDTVGVGAFVNADVIAEGLAGFRPEAVSVEAGRIMIKRLAALAQARDDFAFESTLSGKSVLRLLKRAADSGYDVHVYYLWLPSSDMAVARVRQRVSVGGHDVAEEVIRRRHRRSLARMRGLIDGDVTTWRLYDSSGDGPPRLIASGTASGQRTVVEGARWDLVVKQMEQAQ